jgi:hypothetical protein
MRIFIIFAYVLKKLCSQLTTQLTHGSATGMTMAVFHEIKKLHSPVNWSCQLLQSYWIRTQQHCVIRVMLKMLSHHDIIRSLFSPLVALETIAAQFHPIFWLTGMIFDLAGKGFRPMAPSLGEACYWCRWEDTTILVSRCSAPRMVMLAGITIKYR